jgi:hypothetical protein
VVHIYMRDVIVQLIHGHGIGLLCNGATGEDVYDEDIEEGDEVEEMDATRVAQLVDPAFLARKFLTQADEEIRQVHDSPLSHTFTYTHRLTNVMLNRDG